VPANKDEYDPALRSPLATGAPGHTHLCWLLVGAGQIVIYSQMIFSAETGFANYLSGCVHEWLVLMMYSAVFAVCSWSWEM